jgi:hypothetical protein
MQNPLAADRSDRAEEADGTRDCACYYGRFDFEALGCLTQNSLTADRSDRAAGADGTRDCACYFGRVDEITAKTYSLSYVFSTSRYRYFFANDHHG